MAQRGETGVERERREEECVRGEGDFRIATVHPLFKIDNCRCCTVKSDYTGQPRRVNECCIVRLQVGLKKSEFPKV